MALPPAGAAWHDLVGSVHCDVLVRHLPSGQDWQARLSDTTLQLPGACRRHSAVGWGWQNWGTVAAAADMTFRVSGSEPAGFLSISQLINPAALLCWCSACRRFRCMRPARRLPPGAAPAPAWGALAQSSSPNGCGGASKSCAWQWADGAAWQGQQQPRAAAHGQSSSSSTSSCCPAGAASSRPHTRGARLPLPAACASCAVIKPSRRCQPASVPAAVAAGADGGAGSWQRRWGGGPDCRQGAAAARWAPPAPGADAEGEAAAAAG